MATNPRKAGEPAAGARSAEQHKPQDEVCVRSAFAFPGGLAVLTATPTLRRLETIASAADRHGVNPRTIRRRIADGTITGYRSGPRLVRVDADEVDAALLSPIPAVGRTA